MGRLSAKGSQAFDEIRQARLAIFSARPAQVTKLLNEAQASMKAAQADNTVSESREPVLSHKWDASHRSVNPTARKLSFDLWPPLIHRLKDR
jgi:hypothetical protein